MLSDVAVKRFLWSLFLLSASFVELKAEPVPQMGLSRLSIRSLSDQDRTRIDLNQVYLQMAWATAQYRDVSKYQVPEAKATHLFVDFKGQRRKLPVVELRHAESSEERRLVVMASGLFASEWQDLRRAKWFYDLGYDVLKLPTSFSESFLNAFPFVDAGDLDTEAQILVQSVAAYRAKYGIEVQGHHVIAFGTSYGASLVLKAAEQTPKQVFEKIIALGPIYDFAHAMKVFDAVMALTPKTLSEIDPVKGTQFLMSEDPQPLAKNEGFEEFARNEIAKSLLKRMRLFCVVKHRRSDAESKKCIEIQSFSLLLEHMKVRPLTAKLSPSKDPRVFVLTTETDPYNADLVNPVEQTKSKAKPLAIGHTEVLEKGGHMGFAGSEVEERFLIQVLNASVDQPQ